VTEWTTWLLRTILGAALGGAVNVVVVLWVKRQLRLQHVSVERLLLAVDALIGAGRAQQLRPAVPYRRTPPRRGRMAKLKQYRKGIAAGAGGLLGGLLVYVETNDLEPVVGPLVPPQYRPLVGWLIGAVVIVASVVHATNDPKPAESTTSEEAPTVDELAPPGVPVTMRGGGSDSEGTAPPAAAEDATPPDRPPVDSAAAPPAVAAAPFWAGVPRGEPQAATSRVQLQPVPRRDWE
jgi:hypothetical protein